MAAKKKKATKSRKLAVTDLRAATLSSVKAALGKLPGGGIINGFVLDDGELAALGTKPDALAKEIATAAGKASGFRLKPLVIKRPGSTLIGFMPPPIRP